MAHRDHESDGSELSDFPIICDSSLIPCVPVTRAGGDSESDTILTPPDDKWKLFRQRHARKRPSVCISDQCTRGAECPFRHEMPSSHRFALRRKSALLAKVGINGPRLKLAWGGPQVPKSHQDSESQASARRRSFLSQQRNQPPPMAYISSREVSVSSTSDNNGASSSYFPIICNSSPNPCVLMTRAGVDSESDTILTPQRTTPPNDKWKLFRQRYGRKGPSVCISDQCTRGAECPFRHEMPSSHRLVLRRKAALLGGSSHQRSEAKTRMGKTSGPQI